MSLSGINYVLNEHEDSGQYVPYTMTNDMPCYSYPGASAQNPKRGKSSSVIIYVLGNHDDWSQNGSHAVPLEFILRSIYPASLVDLLDKLLRSSR